jgi:hypothetical protein
MQPDQWRGRIYLDHRQKPAGCGDSISFVGVRLLPNPQLVQFRLPGSPVDHRRPRSGVEAFASRQLSVHRLIPLIGMLLTHWYFLPSSPECIRDDSWGEEMCLQFVPRPILHHRERTKLLASCSLEKEELLHKRSSKGSDSNLMYDGGEKHVAKLMNMILLQRILAKIASAYQKPDGLTVITARSAPALLETLPIGKFFGVGDVTEAIFKEMSVLTGKELKQLSLERLQEKFGKRGRILYSFARGEDDRPVEPNRIRKSIGKETTFADDVTDQKEMLTILTQLAEQVVQRARELEMTGKTVTLKLRWSDFTDVSRAGASSKPLQNTEEIMQIISPLLEQLLQERKAVRLLGVTLSNLISPTAPGAGNTLATLWDGLS